MKLKPTHKDKSVASFYWHQDGPAVAPEVRHPYYPVDLGLPQTEVVVAAAVDAMTGPVPVVMVVVDLVCS